MSSFLRRNPRNTFCRCYSLVSNLTMRLLSSLSPKRMILSHAIVQSGFVYVSSLKTTLCT